MATNISTLGQQMGIITRVKEMQSQMSRYQQQVSTGIKYQNYKDYGADAMRIQRYRSDLINVEGYVYNIDSAQVNIEQMTTSISESITQAGNILSAISIELAKGNEFNLDSIKGAAKTALQLVEANMNSRVGERFLFSGGDVSNKPYNGASVATAGIQQRIEDWLDGTANTADFLTGIEGMTDSQSGYSTTLQSAKKIYARADDSFEVDYTVFANSSGFKDVMNGLRAIAELEFPTEGIDVPTKDEFYDVLDALYRKVQAGVDGLRADSTKLASASQALDDTKQNHNNDKQNLQRVLESTEAADVTDAVIRFQMLQTQLDASYRVTAILGELSLARLLAV